MRAKGGREEDEGGENGAGAAEVRDFRKRNNLLSVVASKLRTFLSQLGTIPFLVVKHSAKSSGFFEHKTRWGQHDFIGGGGRTATNE